MREGLATQVARIEQGERRRSLANAEARVTSETEHRLISDTEAIAAALARVRE